MIYISLTDALRLLVQPVLSPRYDIERTRLWKYICTLSVPYIRSLACFSCLLFWYTFLYCLIYSYVIDYLYTQVQGSVVSKINWFSSSDQLSDFGTSSQSSGQEEGITS